MSRFVLSITPIGWYFLFSAVAPTSASFHYSSRREEEANKAKNGTHSSSDVLQVPKDEGFMGTGISHLYAIPIGICAAVPILEFQWFRPNEEMLVRFVQWKQKRNWETGFFYL